MEAAGTGAWAAARPQSTAGDGYRTGAEVQGETTNLKCTHIFPMLSYEGGVNANGEGTRRPAS